MRTYLREAYLLPMVLCIPAVATLLLMKRWFVPHTYVELAVHLAVVGSVYGSALLWAFASKRATKISLQLPEGDLERPVGAAVENYSQDI